MADRPLIVSTEALDRADAHTAATVVAAQGIDAIEDTEPIALRDGSRRTG